MPDRLARSFIDRMWPQVERALAEALARGEPLARSRVGEAMRYAVLGGGKRLRPVLLLAIADALGRRPEAVMKAACGVELVHGASLVLDDLPCMDHASLRRGRPTVHRAFGEACAVLAAHGLLAIAFRLVVESCTDLGLGGEAIRSAVTVLCDSVGTGGMIGGQEADLELAADAADLATVLAVSRLKTGSLFCACARLAAILTAATELEGEALARFAGHLGLAFQIRDDILDVTGSPGELGKDTGQDADWMSTAGQLGVGRATETVTALCAQAESCLEGLGRPVGLLVGVARVLAAVNGQC